MAAVSWAFALLLVGAGAGKIRHPGPTTDALRSARLPASSWLVRALGGVEVATGLAVVLVGGVAASSALAIAYGTVTAVALRQRGAGAGCGCFGSAGAPVTALHVAVDALGAGVAVGAAAVGAALPGSSIALPAIVAEASAVGLLALGTAVLAAMALRLLLTLAPELRAAVDRVEEART